MRRRLGMATAAAAMAMMNMVGRRLVLGVRVGPGQKTLYTYHRGVGRSKYRPHQGKREIARRLAK